MSQGLLAPRHLTGPASFLGQLEDRRPLAPRFTPRRRAVKRALDVSLALVAIVVLLPALLIVALAVWLDSGRPIIFRQLRVGEGGSVFWMYKFRSMRQDGEPPPMDEPRTLDATAHKQAADPRITRV